MVQKFKKPFHDQERLTKVKKFIEKYWETHHYSPSGPEIAAEFGVVESVTRYWRKRLEFDGYLEVVPSPQPPRTWVPVAIFADRPVFPDSQWSAMMHQMFIDGMSGGGSSFVELVKE